MHARTDVRPYGSAYNALLEPITFPFTVEVHYLIACLYKRHKSTINSRHVSFYMSVNL